MSRLTIKTEHKKTVVSQNLYGIFLEDINRAIDGGLYPELLRNRSFEDSIPPADCDTNENGYMLITKQNWRDEFNNGEGLTRWMVQNQTDTTPIPAWYSKSAVMELNSTETLNEKRQVSLKIQFDKNGMIWNTGFRKIAQTEGKDYRFLMFAKADRGKRVNLRIVVRDDEHECTSCDILVTGGSFHKYQAVMNAGCTTDGARFEITCPEGGTVKLGFVSYMPTETYLGHGLRIDIAEMLAALKPSFLRFPGGCIVEGFSPSTAMRFKNTIGPIWERPGHQLMWHYRTYDGIGFHEYLQFCEDLNMEPIYVTNCGMTCQMRNGELFEGDDLAELLADTLDAIEYAVGDKKTTFGSMRAKNGHKKPFRLNYVEIGNENFGPDYEERYLLFYRAIKEKYPWIKCIANSHLEEKGLPVEIVDEHYYNTAEYFAEHSNQYDQYSRNGISIFLGEVSVIRGYVAQLFGALAEAAFMLGVERNQDVVSFLSYAPLLENVGYQAWFPNMLRFNQTHVYGIPTYYVWKLLGNSRGQYVVESNEETRMIPRSMKGMASLRGTCGLTFRRARWNGLEVKVSHTLAGTVVPDRDKAVLNESGEELRIHNQRYPWLNPEDVFVVFGDREDTVSGTFDIEVKVNKNDKFYIGCFSGRDPKQVYVSDETNPPNEWNVENVNPIYWEIDNGKSRVFERDGDKVRELISVCEAPILQGEFNSFRYICDYDAILFYVNGIMLHAVKVPTYRALHTVVTDTNKEIFIKMVNLADTPDVVKISLDCRVFDEYMQFVLSGGKHDENSFEHPEFIHDIETTVRGAGKVFEHTVPPCSFTVLQLRKKRS